MARQQGKSIFSAYLFGSVSSYPLLEPNQFHYIACNSTSVGLNIGQYMFLNVIIRVHKMFGSETQAIMIGMQIKFSWLNRRVYTVVGNISSSFGAFSN
jgi:hypothetical protein